jgi:type I restriction enzyme S subunit
VKAVWQITRLAEVCQTAAGGTPLKSNKEFYEGGKVPWLQSGEVSQGEISAAKTFITELGLKRSSAKLFPANTVVVAMYGATAGQVGILRFESATNQAVCGILPNKTFIPEFLYYLLLSRKSELVAQAVGNAQPNISQQKIRDMYVPLVTISEQRRIVFTLAQAFGKIAQARANAEENLQNAREIFESYLQSVFTARGEGWAEKRLDEISTFSSGGTPSKTNEGYWNGEIPWVSGRDMKSTRLADSFLHISQSAVDESSTRLAPAGTLLVLVRGMGLAHGAQITELMVPCAFNQDIKGIHVDPSIIPRYLLFALRNRINSSDSVLSNAAHGTLKINSDELRKVRIPIPPLNDQQKAVKTIDLLVAETQRLESIYHRKIAALDELKQSLLHQAFSGQL